MTLLNLSLRVSLIHTILIVLSLGFFILNTYLKLVKYRS